MGDLTNLTNAEIVLATHNRGKVAELQTLLAPYGVTVLSAGDLGLPEPVEDGDTFEANALIKATQACGASGKIALADDSGLAVDALGGMPGIYSADWAMPETAQANSQSGRDFNRAMDRVLTEMGDTPNRTAQFVCVLALATPNGGHRTFRGQVVGDIVAPRGDNGFGYDPLFQPHGYDVTFAEMDGAEKQRISHRKNAFDMFVQSCFVGA